MGEKMTWEDAVRWYRAQPNNMEAIRANYFDLPVFEAAKRYATGEEFAEVLRLLGKGNGRTCLDVGAGNGIASYALAINGWQVTALEPDSSDEVGAGAISSIATQAGVPITVLREWGERIPLPDQSQDAVHARQVLHHAADLGGMMRELSRILKPGGIFLSTRDHVVDDDKQLAQFRANHPLHHLYGGENAFSLDQYKSAFTAAGLDLQKEYGPLDSILNFYPGTEAQRLDFPRAFAARRYRGMGRYLLWSGAYRRWQLTIAKRSCEGPGRAYSFLAVKPKGQAEDGS